MGLFYWEKVHLLINVRLLFFTNVIELISSDIVYNKQS